MEIILQLIGFLVDPPDPIYEKRVMSYIHKPKQPPAPAPKVAIKASPPVRASFSKPQITGDVWGRLAACESGGVPTKNTGNGYYGMYQFSVSTWNSMGTGYSRADLAPASVQTAAAQRLQARSGWGQWPGCARKLGLL